MKYLVVLLLSCVCLGEVKIGVLTSSRPFAWTSSGEFLGTSVDIFKQVQKRYNIPCKMMSAGANVAAALDSLAAGDFDVLVGPVSVTEDRHARFLFTRPYFLNHLSMAVVVESNSRLHAMLSALKEPFLTVFPVLGGVILFMSLCFFLFDRKRGQGRGRFLSGFFEAFWEVIIILIQGEILKDTKSIGKRALVLIWLLLSIALLSMFIGTVTASLTNFNENEKSIVNLKRSDLESQKIVVVKGSVAEREVIRLGGVPVAVKDRDQAYKILMQGEVFGYVDDFLLLKNLVHQCPKAKMTRLNIKNDEVAFAIRKDRKGLLEKFNAVITNMQDTGTAESICRTHLGSDAVLCIL